MSPWRENRGREEKQSKRRGETDDSLIFWDFLAFTAEFNENRIGKGQFSHCIP